MEENKLRGLMGLCVRAGQAAFGMDGCLQAIRTGKVGLLLLDENDRILAESSQTDSIRKAWLTCGTN